MSDHVELSTRPCPPHCAAGSHYAILARLLRAFALGMLCLYGTACKTAPAPVSSSDRYDTFDTAPDWSVASLGPGDVVSVIVQGHPEISTPENGTSLDETGTLQLANIGAVKLNGLSLAMAREACQSAYAKFMHEPSVLVDVVSRASSQYFVLGQIREPGPRPLERPTTALEAVSGGGFFLNAADRFHVYIVRPQGDEIEVHEFNVESPDASGLVQIRPGDIVFVRRRGSQRFQEEFLPLLAPFQILLPAAAIGAAF